MCYPSDPNDLAQFVWWPMKLLAPFLLLFFSVALCGLILPGSLRSYPAPQATFDAVSIKPDKSGTIA